MAYVTCSPDQRAVWVYYSWYILLVDNALEGRPLCELYRSGGFRHLVFFNVFSCHCIQKL